MSYPARGPKGFILGIDGKASAAGRRSDGGGVEMLADERGGMSYPARGREKRGAGAPLAGMRPWSESGRAGDFVPLRASGVRSRRAPLPPCGTRPKGFILGIDGKASAADRRCDGGGVEMLADEAAAA